jgi:hypothetical protein
MTMTGNPSDVAPDAPLEAVSAQQPENRWLVGTAAFMCVFWIGFVAIAALVFGALGCMNDTTGRTDAICEAESAGQTVEVVVVLVLPLLAAIAAGAFAVWRRSYRPIALTAALLWLLPPVAVVLIAELTTRSV